MLFGKTRTVAGYYRMTAEFATVMGHIWKRQKWSKKAAVEVYK